jgi:predicted DNA-binding transcriptional regulator YafY
VRADRLVSLVLLLQARGRMTALALAGELGVCVRTVYRDLEALATTGVPVLAEPGPGGGCRLLEGYRFPLRGLRPEEAEALLILGVPGAVRELGLDAALTNAQHQIRVTAGLAPGPEATLVHLDMPRWFGGREAVPHLRCLAQALRLGRRLALGYARDDGLPAAAPPRVVGPLGLVDKAGTWYLVAATTARPVCVFRVARITSARVLAERFERPPDFELAGFWDRWSREFVATRPSTAVRLRASPDALAAFPETFGDGVTQALEAAHPPDKHGWQEVTLSFEHELAAAYRLAGFGGGVEVLSPPSVRERLVAAAHGILGRYGERTGPASAGERPVDSALAAQQ